MARDRGGGKDRSRAGQDRAGIYIGFSLHYVRFTHYIMSVRYFVT